MIYGLYLSATGVMANSHRQDVIANNLANVETVGFKKDLAMFQARRTEAGERNLSPRLHSNSDLEAMGGGMVVGPSVIDMSQGDLETTGNSLDVAIQGDGFLAVQKDGKVLLTRDGRLGVRNGQLALASGEGIVLDARRKPIPVASSLPITVAEDGTLTQGKAPIGRLGLFDVPNRQALHKQGGVLLSFSDEKTLRPATGTLRGFALERANVDPSTELANLLDAERQLEANANLIRYQDQTLGRLVNEVGKIG